MSSNVTYSIRLMLTSWVTSRVVRISGESGILMGTAMVVGISGESGILMGTAMVVGISGESGILMGMATVVGIPDVPLSGISMAAPIIHLLLRK